MSQTDTRELMVTIRCLVYNHEPYLRQCLDGFVMQKTNFRFEAIVHDDASTDGSAEIIREYAEKFPDIIKPIFEAENQYSKRDGSIRRIMDANTHGKYVALCEGDDYWIDSLKLQKQVDFLESNPDYSLCFHNAIRLNERVAVKEKIASFCFFYADRQISTEEIIADWCIPTASLLYRREALKDIKLPRFFSGDYTLELILASIGKVYYLDRYMSVYRINSGGVSGGISAKKWAEQLCALLDWFDEFTSYKFKTQILKRKKGANQFVRYCTLKQKNTLLPFVLMPSYMLQKTKDKINKVVE